LPTLPDADVSGLVRPESTIAITESRTKAVRAISLIANQYTQDLTMKEIGAQLGLDESRVSQIRSAALNRVRTQVRSMLSPPLSAAKLLTSSAIYVEQL